MRLGLCGTAFVLFQLYVQVTQAENGFVTFYGTSSDQEASGDGACGYQSLLSADWPFGNYVSLGLNNSIVQSIGSNQGGCGQCIEAKCVGDGCVSNAESVQLFVTDECDCLADQLNVPRDLFLRSFGESAALGQVNITYQQIQCQPPGDIKVKVLNARGGDGNYIAFILLDVAGNGGLLGLDLRASNNQTWRSMLNSYGNVWEGSNLGVPPYDLRLTPFDMPVLILPQAIPLLTNDTFDTGAQLSQPTATAPAALTTSGAAGPLAFTLPAQAPRARPPRTFAPDLGNAAGPSQDTIVYSNVDQNITLSGVRISVPLYYAPIDSSLLGGYPGIRFDFVDCQPSTAILNLTVDLLPVPSTDGASLPAWSIHTVDYRPVARIGQDEIYQLIDFTFFNLEAGSFAQLVDPIYVTFTNASYDGNVSVVNPSTKQSIKPQFLNSSTINQPGSLAYNILLPPGPNEGPTDIYLGALKTIFYYLSTLTLGNDGGPTTSPICGPGFPALGPWADYVRNILADIGPSSNFVGVLYDNIPIGQLYDFQQRSFVINNAVITGRELNTTTQLSASDCGTQCRAYTIAATSSDNICSTWTWCGSIVGCDTLGYQVCSLKSSTASQNSTSPSGFFSFTQNSSTRATSGSLILPPPTGVLPLFVNSSTGIAPAPATESPTVRGR